MDEDKSEMLNAKYWSLNKFIDEWAALLYINHPGAIGIHISWKIDKPKGMVNFIAEVEHDDHICVLTDSQPCVRSIDLTQENKKMPSTLDMMSASDREACVEAGRGPGVDVVGQADNAKKEDDSNDPGLDKSAPGDDYIDSEPGPLDQDDDSDEDDLGEFMDEDEDDESDD